MTTEDDFHAVLDANPNDHHTRLVFADWLQEHGDSRAEGYRALGVQRLYPFTVRMAQGPWQNRKAWMFGGPLSDECPKAQQLPPDWFKKVGKTEGSDDWWRRFLYRRTCENVVARAFAKLPAERRTELLTAPAPPKRKSPKRKSTKTAKPKSAKAAKPKSATRKRTKG